MLNIQKTEIHTATQIYRRSQEDGKVATVVQKLNTHKIN